MQGYIRLQTVSVSLHRPEALQVRKVGPDRVYPRLQLIVATSSYTGLATWLATPKAGLGKSAQGLPENCRTLHHKSLINGSDTSSIKFNLVGLHDLYISELITRDTRRNLTARYAIGKCLWKSPPSTCLGQIPDITTELTLTCTLLCISTSSQYITRVAITCVVWS